MRYFQPVTSGLMSLNTDYRTRSGRVATLPITDYRLPITDYRLPITDYRLPITDYRTRSGRVATLPITDYRLPITDFHLPEIHPLQHNLQEARLIGIDPDILHDLLFP